MRSVIRVTYPAHDQDVAKDLIVYGNKATINAIIPINSPIKLKPKPKRE